MMPLAVGETDRRHPARTVLALERVTLTQGTTQRFGDVHVPSLSLHR
jgi:hypothetical protein